MNLFAAKTVTPEKCEATTTMLNSSIWLILSLLWPSFDGPPIENGVVQAAYASLTTNHGPKPDFDVFQSGLVGYQRLQLEDRFLRQGILTIIDFRRSSNEKRMWVIDLTNREIVHHSLVAHGRNSGELYATRFSNTPGSLQSSLGFFATGSIYIGKHGTSLKLHGLEKGINDNALPRAIVIHGADYASERYLRQAGRLGRSFGCPAIPTEDSERVIQLLANGTCVFIFYPSDAYQKDGLIAQIKNSPNRRGDWSPASSAASKE
jgi:hypothetical protein